MSEKFKDAWRKVVEGFELFLTFVPIAFSTLVSVVFVLFTRAIIIGVIISICWNIAMTTMFDFQKITMFQAIFLVFTIEWFKSGTFTIVENIYAPLKEETFNFNQNEKMSTIVSVIIFLIFLLILIFITTGVTMYTWNSILPHLLNIELTKINLGQSFAFACLVNWLLGDFGSLAIDDSEYSSDDEDPFDDENY